MFVFLFIVCAIFWPFSSNNIFIDTKLRYGGLLANRKFLGWLEFIKFVAFLVNSMRTIYSTFSLFKPRPTYMITFIWSYKQTIFKFKFWIGLFDSRLRMTFLGYSCKTEISDLSLGRGISQILELLSFNRIPFILMWKLSSYQL